MQNCLQQVLQSVNFATQQLSNYSIVLFPTNGNSQLFAPLSEIHNCFARQLEISLLLDG